MSRHEFPIGLTQHQSPMIHSVFVERDTQVDHPIPPSSDFIITETGIYIVTETGDKLITESAQMQAVAAMQIKEQAPQSLKQKIVLILKQSPLGIAVAVVTNGMKTQYSKWRGKKSNA